jgi:hypothetical protein
MIEKLCCIVLARPYCQIDDIIIVIVINATALRPGIGRHRAPLAMERDTPLSSPPLTRTLVEPSLAFTLAAPAILNLAHHGPNEMN